MNHWLVQKPRQDQVFLVTAAAAFLFAVSWSLALILECGFEPHGVRWLKHSLTFGFMHHCFFPVAAGILAALMSKERFSRIAKGWLLLMSLAMLVAMILFTLDQKPQPYMFTKPTALLDLELDARTKWQAYEDSNTIYLATDKADADQKRDRRFGTIATLVTLFGQFFVQREFVRQGIEKLQLPWYLYLIAIPIVLFGVGRIGYAVIVRATETGTESATSLPTSPPSRTGQGSA